MLDKILALGSALALGVEETIHRTVLIKEDPLSYAFLFQLLSALCFLPFLFLDFQIPKESIAWVFAISAAVLWGITTYLQFVALTSLEASIKSPLSKVKILFVFLLSIFLLKEQVTTYKITGTMLIFVSMILLTTKNLKSGLTEKSKAIIIVIIAAFISAMAIILDKKAIQFFKPETYGFLVYIIPSVFMLPFLINRKKKMYSLLNNKIGKVLLAIVLSSLSYYLLISALKQGEVSVILPISELYTIVAVITGILILGEKENIRRKIVATIFAIIGTVLIII